MFVMLCAIGASKAESARPRVLLDPAGLIRLREEIRTIPWKREVYERVGDEGQTFIGAGGIKARADVWLGRDVEIPARSGHLHHFFCDCGNRLQFPQDGRPRPDAGYECPECGKVYKGEKFDAAVRWWAHNKLAAAACELGLVYAVEGDERYAGKAAEILLKYADAYPGPHTTLLEGGMMYQSLCEAVWSIPLASAYDFIYDSRALSAEDREKIEKHLLRPIADGLIAVGTHGNWESWHLSAVGVIGYAIDDDKLVDYAIKRFKRQIRNELGDDGLWPESVHGYHFYPLNAFLYLAEASRNNGTDLYNWEAKPGKGLKAMFTAPLQYMYPNMQLPAINDGWWLAEMPTQMYELAYARYGDPDMGWVLKRSYEQRGRKREGLRSLLYGESLDDDLPPPKQSSINFPGLGIAVLRSEGGSMLTFDHGPFLGHGQLDKMGITLYANNRLLVADYGTTGYGSSMMEWCVSTPAHNTVVVDGKSQERTSERRLTRFEDGELLGVAEAETEEAYPGVYHRRTVMRVGDDYVIIDRLRSEEEHTLDWMLRCEGELSVESGEADPEPLGYKFIEERARFTPAGDWRAVWEADGQGLVLSMPSWSGVSVTSAECPAETGVRKVRMIIARKHGKEAEFLAVLSPFRGEPVVSCTMESGLLRIDHGGGAVDWVFTGKRDARAPLQTDAEFALVRTMDSEVVGADVIGGSRLVWKGRVIIREKSR